MNAEDRKAQAEGRIRVVMKATGCNEETATAYLEAEEWDCIDAVRSMNGDSTRRSRSSSITAEVYCYYLEEYYTGKFMPEVFSCYLGSAIPA